MARTVQSMEIGETRSLDSNFQPRNRSVQPQTQPKQGTAQQSNNTTAAKPAAMTHRVESTPRESTARPQTLYGAIKAGWQSGVDRAKAEARRIREDRPERENDTSTASSGTTLQDRVDNVKRDLRKVWRSLRT